MSLDFGKEKNSLVKSGLGLVRFAGLLGIKGLRYVSYPTKCQWVSEPADKNWEGARLVLILNHTSLFEYIYGGVIPLKFLWKMAHNLVYPVAKETLDHPVHGKILPLLAPHVAPLTRKRDKSWSDFAESIMPRSVLIMMPEGRMMRPDGKDKHGKEMTVKTGIADIIRKFQGESIILAYSGGLHHVMPPVAPFPKPFKKIAVNLPIKKYLRHNHLFLKEKI